MNPRINIFWFRRDLRLEDNAGLYHALRGGLPVVPIFIFDRDILDRLENKQDRRVVFIAEALERLQGQLAVVGSSLEVFYDFPLEVFRGLLAKYRVGKVYCNGDYEPYARERDAAIDRLLRESGSSLSAFKDQVIFEKNEVLNEDGRAYTVFTPYRKKWKSLLHASHLQAYPTEKYFSNFYKQASADIPTLFSLGFVPVKELFPSPTISRKLLARYGEERDFPAMAGTSRLGVHLRFGTISIRWLAGEALASSETFLNELIWRDFYQCILWHFPEVGRGRAFKKKYDLIPWRNNESEFERWCAGNTGYPMVDAGMRELRSTGYMHNRVRMITASFLTKHLLIDWRWGEAWFAEQLLDFDLAANNGGWQWAAGSGCDAAPYFRVFNPRLQAEKFDPQSAYIRRWVPEFEEADYLKPMVAHEEARKRAVETYRKALSG